MARKQSLGQRTMTNFSAGEKGKTMRTGLWRNRDFMKLWVGETVSLFGSQFTQLALPLTAVLFLQATPLQMGILGACGFAPFILLSLFAGVWIDRSKRRPILIAANLGKAGLLILIPVLHLLNLLRIELLYAIGFLDGALSVFFQLAYQSYLPSLVNKEDLLEGNSKLQASASVAQVGGLGIAGVLINLFTAPIVLMIDAATYLFSSVSLMLIQKAEPSPSPSSTRKNIGHDIKEGFQTVIRNPYLRSIAGEAATFNFFSQMISTLLILYWSTELGIGKVMIGLFMTALSIGSLLGSLMAGAAARKLGLGNAIVFSMAAACLTPLLFPAVSGPSPLYVSLLIAALLLNGLGVSMSNIHGVSLRQTVTPERLLGRMNASYRFFVSGVIPVGAFLGGVLGDWIGIRPTLFLAATGLLGALLIIVVSPIPGLRQLPIMPAQQQPDSGARV
ncbi:MFS transporter [Paenibacillus thermoaerophilus]|nr:MFS transporter [Paenibacillus thermoaerophilus]